MRQKRDWLSWLGYKGPTPYPPDYEPIPWEFTLKDLESFCGESPERLKRIIKKILEAYPHIKEEELQEAFDIIRRGEKTPYQALRKLLFPRVKDSAKPLSRNFLEEVIASFIERTSNADKESLRRGVNRYLEEREGNCS